MFNPLSRRGTSPHNRFTVGGTQTSPEMIASGHQQPVRERICELSTKAPAHDLRDEQRHSAAQSRSPSLWSDVFANFGASEIIALILRNGLRVDQFYQLWFNLHSLTAKPPRKIGGGQLQPLQSNELTALYAQLPELPANERKELLARIHFYQRGFRNCYALRENGVIGYLQWIAYPSENDWIVGAHGRRFAPLSASEVMIENAFTFPAFRGRGFLGFGTWELLNLAKAQGHARAVTFVHTETLEALNTFVQMGFRIQRRLREVSVCGWPWRFWGNEWPQRVRIAAAQRAALRPCEQ